jgi:hypothetical protein
MVDEHEEDRDELMSPQKVCVTVKATRTHIHTNCFYYYHCWYYCLGVKCYTFGVLSPTTYRNYFPFQRHTKMWTKPKTHFLIRHIVLV